MAATLSTNLHPIRALPPELLGIPTLGVHRHPAQAFVKCALVGLLGPLGEDTVVRANTEDCPDYMHGDCESDVVANAAEALGRIGKRGDLALPRLIELATSHVPDGAKPIAYRIKLNALEALAGFPERADQTIPILVDHLDRPRRGRTSRRRRRA